LNPYHTVATPRDRVAGFRVLQLVLLVACSEGDVINVAAEQLGDLSDVPRSVGGSGRSQSHLVPALVPRIRMDLTRVRQAPAKKLQ
jgi:hypothetical protein